MTKHQKNKKKQNNKGYHVGISPSSWARLVLLDKPNGPRLRRARNRHRPGVAQERIQGVETLSQVPVQEVGG